MLLRGGVLLVSIARVADYRRCGAPPGVPRRLRPTRCWKCLKPQVIHLELFMSNGPGVQYCGLSADCGEVPQTARLQGARIGSWVRARPRNAC
jgi:hypothetical protein